MTKLTIEDLLRNKQEVLQLQLLTADSDLGRAVQSPTVSSPGLVLAGFTSRFPPGRLQVLGETELSFMHSLGEEALARAVGEFLALDPPALIITKHLEPPPVLLQLAAERRIPVLQSTLKTSELYRRLQPYLEERFAPTTTLHGSLADVYGVGLLFVGRSGIGKSECVLDLVERGHRLVADDVVIITRRGLDVLIGRGHELQSHHMEIRGIGIVDIRTLFGIRAIRQQKRLEVVVQLVDWNSNVPYDRTGLETEEVDILGVKLPKVVVPLNAGKNITVISEVVAMNHLLKYAGIHSARLFNDRLREAMRPVREYLEEDYE